MLDISQFLKEIKSQIHPRLALLLEQIAEGVNNLATHVGVDPAGKLAPPDPIKAINVKAGTDHVHVTLTDTQPIRKGVEYFVEYSTDGTNWRTEHLGPSRERVIALPAKDDNGNPVNYSFRAFHQYRGSDPSKPVVFGGTLTPATVTLSGSSKLTLQAPVGSGTAAPDGSQPGKGYGVDLQRLPIGPKVPTQPHVF